jgi:heterodisulfide reductase subunit A
MNQRIRVDNRVMVLGSAPEAGWVAQELLDLGYAVYWVTAETVPAYGPLDHPKLTRYGECALVRLDGHVGGFVGRFRLGGNELSLGASAVVVATGSERYYPQERYGLPLSSNVLTTSQVQKQLQAPRPTGAALPYRNKRAILLLDLGGETAKETACEAMRLAIDLRASWHCEVLLFYQNLKVDTYNLERLTREMREKGIVFCRYADPKVAIEDEGVTLSYIEGTTHGDLLILPEAVRPRADTPELAALLRVRLGEDGFFQNINIHEYRPGLSVRKGIFFTGRCHMDGDTADIRADAMQAAANVDALLGAGFLEPEAIIAHVDSTKCIRCYTCVRTCPHAAVEIVDYEDVTAARVVDLACRGCGACVANCPVRAIDLLGQAMPAWAQSA